MFAPARYLTQLKELVHVVDDDNAVAQDGIHRLGSGAMEPQCVTRDCVETGGDRDRPGRVSRAGERVAHTGHAEPSRSPEAVARPKRV